MYAVLTWPLLNQTGWYSRTLSVSLLIVRPMYDAPQEPFLLAVSVYVGLYVIMEHPTSGVL